MKKPTKEASAVLSVRVPTWQFDALCKRAQKRGVGLGEVLRALLYDVLAAERS